MADIDFDDYGGSPSISGGHARGMVTFVGAACSAALIIGLGIWGYRLAVRDVEGIPVIRAGEGPMRIAPANPGGAIAAHMGLAINVIAAVGTTDALPDEIVLAPAPAVLSEEDTAGLAVLAQPVAPASLRPGPMPLEAAALTPVEVPTGTDTRPSSGAMDPAPLPAPAADSTDVAVATALAEALSLDVEPLSDAGDTAIVSDPLPDGDVVPDGVTTTNDGGAGMARSLRPRARPEGTRVTDAQTSAEPDPQTAPLATEIDAVSLTRGTRLVQLGAFDSADLARAEWSKVAARFGDLMTGKAPVVQAAESGGRTFYRLRAHGFAGEDDVRRFCAALVAENAACIPATVR